MKKHKHLIGWLSWVIFGGLLFWLGRVDFQVRNVNFFIVILVLISFLFVIAFNFLYGENK